MNGIFNYQVPGRTQATDAVNANNSANPTTTSSNQANQGSHWFGGGLSSIRDQMTSLLQSLLQHVRGGANNPGITTYAIGEEDGGLNPPAHPPINPPTITTYAIGEEDGGIRC